MTRSPAPTLATAPSPVSRLRRMYHFLLIAAALLLVASIVGALVSIEDWSRDLTTNYAETSDEHADVRLRAILTKRSAEDVVAAVSECVQELPRWTWKDGAPPGDLGSGDSATLELVRTTRLMRFRDDIVVRIERTEAGTVVNASSRSRVGKGDLGQNPRNLRELLDKLRARLS